MKISAARRSGTRPTVSVVIPCYNYGNYLPAAVASVTGQSGVDLDIIIVDDASTDGSQDVARALAAADPRIRLILHEQNKRHIATYNDGLREARGDYVVLLSADDLLAPGSLERSTALMEHHPEIGLVYGYAPEFSDVPPTVSSRRITWTRWTGSDWIAWMCRRGTNILVNPEAMLRRSIMDELVGYRADMPHSADMELWMRAAALGGVGRVNGPDQAYYRVHDSNMHLTDYAGLLTDMRARRDTFDSFFAENPTLADSAALTARAHRSIAHEALRYAETASRGDGSAGGAGVEDLIEFARETWGGIVNTSAWRTSRRRLHRPSSAIRRSYDKRLSDVRAALLWRRWRRFGV
ncbi:glycosyltransferase [soil metagenome]